MHFQHDQHLAAILNIELVFRIFSTAYFLVINTITASVFQQICSFIHKENVLLKIIASYSLVVFCFDYAYLIRLHDVTKPTQWPLPLQSI